MKALIWNQINDDNNLPLEGETVLCKVLINVGEVDEDECYAVLTFIDNKWSKDRGCSHIYNGAENNEFLEPIAKNLKCSSSDLI